MRIEKGVLPCIVYVILSVLTIAIWIWSPDISLFIGMSSPIYAFLFALWKGYCLSAHFALAWIPIFLVNLVIWLVFAWTRKKYIPFLVTVGLDLLVSSLIIFTWIFNGISDLGTTIVGWLGQVTYFCWMLYYIHNAHIKV